MKRPCLNCGTPTTGSRCPLCQNAHDRKRWANGKSNTYDTEWRKTSQRIRAAHIAAHGHVCPGWQRPAHASTDLVVDHDVGVLCRACNSSKAGGHDKR